MLYFREDILNHVICIVWNSWNKKFEIFKLSKTVLNKVNETSLRDRYSYLECFSSVFPRIRTEYGEIRSISPYSIRMWENMDQKSSKYKHFLRSIYGRITEYVTARVKDDNLRKQKDSNKYFNVEWKSSLFAILLPVNTNLAIVVDLGKITNY